MQEAAAAAETAAKSGGTFSLFPVDGLFGRIFTVETALKAGKVALTLVIGLILLGLVVSVLKRLTRKRLDSRSGALVVKVAQYLGLALIAFNVFDAAAVDLSALLGAAGIAGIALGFAAQTSVSNFISGFFLVSEKTFAVGDVITVDGTTGVVFSIDALSVKLRTFDNRLVRIPNETLIKTNVSNVTRFPVRRLNIDLTVAFGTDISRVQNILMDTAARNRDVLRNPEPFFMVQRFGPNGIELFMGVWLASDDWVQGNNSMLADMQRRLAAEGIALAHPTMTVRAEPSGSLPGGGAAPAARKRKPAGKRA